MIKCIDLADLKPGMYIHDLNCDWMSHPFLRNRFLVTGDDEIERIRDAGIHQLYIDTDKGLDVAHAPSAGEVRQQMEQELRALAGQESQPARKVEAAEEFGQAHRIHAAAHQIVRGIMQDVRLGRQVQLERVEPVVEQMTASILRNNGALLALCRIKHKDDYTFLHSVSVGALMLSFCHAMKRDQDTLLHAGVGGMLHDIGKMTVPDAILNKPGKLSETEFAAMKCHVVESEKILRQTPGMSVTAIEVAAQHHERHDGSGYPRGLKGGEISELGQMAAIVDVYDALTSDRCYHRGMPPTDALRKIYEWSKFHFNPALVQAFLRCTGIYPVGTLVRLESGKLAVVVEQGESNLLTPTVKAFFSTRSNSYIVPQLIDLAHPPGQGGGDRIVRHESPEHWRLDPLRFL